MTLPTRITAWFDGLPWTNEANTLTIVVIIPFLLILGWRFLSLRMPIIFLAVLLALKIVLFVGAPAGGLLVKVEPNMPLEQLEEHIAGMCHYFPEKVPN